MLEHTFMLDCIKWLYRSVIFQTQIGATSVRSISFLVLEVLTIIVLLLYLYWTEVEQICNLSYFTNLMQFGGETNYILGVLEQTHIFCRASTNVIFNFDLFIQFRRDTANI